MQTKTRCAAFAVSSNGVHRVGARDVARVICFCVVAAEGQADQGDSYGDSYGIELGQRAGGGGGIRLLTWS
jgi:hypothetical protein